MKITDELTWVSNFSCESSIYSGILPSDWTKLISMFQHRTYMRKLTKREKQMFMVWMFYNIHILKQQKYFIRSVRMWQTVKQQKHTRKTTQSKDTSIQGMCGKVKQTRSKKLQQTIHHQSNVPSSLSHHQNTLPALSTIS